MSTDLWETLKSIGNAMEVNRLQRETEEAARQAAAAAKAAAGAPQIIARYLTAGGATVDVIERAGYFDQDGFTETHAACSGCPAKHTVEWGWDAWAAEVGQPQENFDEGGNRSTPQAREWAQEHAEKCRAMPKPEAK